MKKSIFLSSLIFLTVQLFASNNMSDLTIPPEEIAEVKILKKYDSCTIVEIEKKDGTILINVIAAIATQLIPTAVDYICDEFYGDDDVCGVVHSASEALSYLGGYKMYKGISKGLRWVAKKLGSKRKSSIAIETKTWEIAEKVAGAIEAYKTIGNLPYSNRDYDYVDNYDYCTCNREEYIYSDSGDLIDSEYDYNYYYGDEDLIEPYYEESYIKIGVENNCIEEAKFLMHFENIYGEWETRGWYSIEYFEKTMLKDVETTNRIFYFYAKGTTTHWGGDDTYVTYNGKRYGMREVYMNSSFSSGISKYFISISCD